MAGDGKPAASAFAKVNLGLRIAGLRRDGFHDLRSLLQSVSWHDTLRVGFGAEDSFAVEGDVRALDTSTSNLAWRALELARSLAGIDRPLEATLTKRIPVAAGLGGGSADAAAALGLGGRLFGLGFTTLAAQAAALGADVPFCLTGGTAVVAGKGDEVAPIDSPPGGYALALVVPPVMLLTADVYRMWDRLEGPEGPAVPEAGLPPSLRAFAPLGNDLLPAAAAVAPVVEEWRSELADRWGGPVAMSGSGPTLFGFFPTEGEAADALTRVPAGARAAHAALPVPVGWEAVH